MLLDKRSSGERWRVRADGPDKVTGKLAYLTDMTAPGMLVGLVLRSPHPHALIMAIRTEAAKALTGVHAVLTYADVPGLNAFGIARQDQPVFCFDRVRYIGDAVAAVAADTLELAELALKLIEVDYDIQPVLDSPDKALAASAPHLHPDGNVLHRTEFKKGDAESGFAECLHIVEETYVTPRQMHTYMETEGGLFTTSPGGRLTVYAPTQHGFMDRLQLARILCCPEEQIRVVSSPIGGSFGGKDELNVQPYGALLAIATGCPVKIHNSRKESVRVGLKRHPMTLWMRTGVNAEGRIVAHQVRVTADTGAYATLGAEVLNFTTEHIIGPYRYDNIDVESVSAYTNNGMSGEFRGFGGNQAIFALEGQMDRLAEKLGLDPWQFRRLNMRNPNDLGPVGQQIATTDGVIQVWEALASSPLWVEKQSRSLSISQVPWVKVGIGAALIMHGSGLGVGIPDTAGGRLKLAPDGKIEAVFGYEEFGQGLIATLELMLIEQFGFAADDLRIIIGDTDIVPDSGSSTASRATSMMWKSLQNMRIPFITKMLEAAGQLLRRSPADLILGYGGIYWRNGEKRLISYAGLASSAEEPIECETSFHFPASSSKRVGAHFIYTYSAVAVKVEVNTLSGRIHVTDQFHTVAAGPVMNPQGFLGQIEGGSSMALGFALTEEALMDKGQYITKNMDTYLIPTIMELRGNVQVLPIEDLPEGDNYGPRGIGEVSSVGLAPAISEAVYDAVGKRVNQLPIDPQLLQEKPAFIGKAVNS